MWLPLLGLLLGIALGEWLPVEIPREYGRYFSIAILAALDSTLGALRASLEGTFDLPVFVTGFVGNALLAAFLTYLGDRLGVELYYAALFAFGYRMFQNLGFIRRALLRSIRLAGAGERNRAEKEGSAAP